MIFLSITLPVLTKFSILEINYGAKGYNVDFAILIIQATK